MLTVEQLQKRSATERRVMIRPKVAVQAKTPEQKREVSQIAKQVIAEHYAVLAALKDR
jgi:predicted negative regulator of RcsB-dependent stress response